MESPRPPGWSSNLVYVFKSIADDNDYENASPELRQQIQDLRIDKR
ncbi:hypothetical protein A2U01_0077804, partial [Trifolium medium]|nr:hypothetical protein [Trifolium medium]